MKSCTYVQFYVGDLEGCGTDSVYILDGRNTLGTMVLDAQARADKLRQIHKYTHFEVRRGNFTEYTTLVPWTLVIPVVPPFVESPTEDDHTLYATWRERIRTLRRVLLRRIECWECVRGREKRLAAVGHISRLEAARNTLLRSSHMAGYDVQKHRYQRIAIENLKKA